MCKASLVPPRQSFLSILVRICYAAMNGQPACSNDGTTNPQSACMTLIKGLHRQALLNNGAKLVHLCDTSLQDHVPNVVILTRCNTFSVESQLQSKRLRWLGHMFRMPLLSGQGLPPPGFPRSSFNDVAMHDGQLRRIAKPYRDAQNRLLWRDNTCLART